MKLIVISLLLGALCNCSSESDHHQVIVVSGHEGKPVAGVKIFLSYVSSPHFPKAITDHKGVGDFTKNSWQFTSCVAESAPFSFIMRFNNGAPPRPLVVYWPSMIFKESGVLDEIQIVGKDQKPVVAVKISKNDNKGKLISIGITNEDGVLVLPTNVGATDCINVSNSENTLVVDLSSWVDRRQRVVIILPTITDKKP